MAVYRNVHLSFWTDNKVEDDFTPEDKYFYLYLMTNPQTNLCGCYEVSFSQMTRQTGYNKETIMRLIDRFENVYKVIRYNESTKEILLLNWHKYNWSKSEKTLKGVESVANHIKCDAFKEYVFGVVNGIRTDTPYIPHTYPIQASDTVTDINNIDITNNYINSNSNINITNNKSYSFDNHSNIENLEYVNNEKGLNIHPLVYEVIYDWMEYKDQKKPKSVNHYGTEKGVTTLITKFIKNCNDYGLNAVRHAVEESMSNNYQGIVWDFADKYAKKTNVQHKKQSTNDSKLEKQLENVLNYVPDGGYLSLEEIDHMLGKGNTNG